jgi:vesicle-associated membrane protein 7
MTTNVLLYSVVAHGTTPLAEFSLASEGNIKTMALRMLEQIDPSQQWAELSSNKLVLYSLTEPDRMTYICLTTDRANVQLRRSFLEEIKGKWRSKYGNQGTSMKAYEKNAEFSNVIKTAFNTYNSERAQKVALIKDNLQKAQDETAQNLTKALARGEQLEIMSQKAEKIRDSAQAFHRSAGNLKRAMCWQKWRWYIIGGSILLILIFILVMFLCGGPSFSKCKN